MSAETFRKLTAMGLNNDQIAGVLDLMEANERQWKEADEARKAVTRERVQRWRDAQKSDVTLQKRNGNVTKRLATRVEDSSSNLDIDKKDKQDDASPKAPPKNGCRIPHDFEPNVEWAVLSQGLTPTEAAHEAAQFEDYWRSKPGKEGRKLDWNATWQMWVRNAVKRIRGASRPSTGPPKQNQNPFGGFENFARKRGLIGVGPGSNGSPDENAGELPRDRQRPDAGSQVIALRGGLAGRYERGDL